MDNRYPDQPALSTQLDQEIHYPLTDLLGTEENRNNYRSQPNYHTYPYKRTVKQFRSLQITDRVLLSTSL